MFSGRLEDRNRPPKGVIMKGFELPMILTVAIAVAVPTASARTDTANRGSASASHMSSRGMANTNGPNAVDRDKGLARAEDRMSAKGLAHEKATTHATKHHGKKKKRTAATG